MVDSPRELLAVALRTFDLEAAGLSVNSSAAQLAAAGITEQALQVRARGGAIGRAGGGRGVPGQGSGVVPAQARQRDGQVQFTAFT